MPSGARWNVSPRQRAHQTVCLCHTHQLIQRAHQLLHLCHTRQSMLAAASTRRCSHSVRPPLTSVHAFEHLQRRCDSDQKLAPLLPTIAVRARPVIAALAHAE